ncbi:uncharacterized protein METZ01_LOCUS154966 [marine metagenome]|uniref:Uncharacterized protein n=1 Tax=marine metagenome TaxID=408172 RepID=A0A382ALU7_9ZZZZ
MRAPTALLYCNSGPIICTIRRAGFLAGPIVAELKASPAISNISAKLFDVLESHTETTRGPVK